MHSWRVSSDPATGGFTHRVADGLGHGWLAPVMSSVFARLRVSASLYDGRHFWPLNAEADLVRFELAQNVETERWVYNERMFAAVSERKRPLEGSHAGYRDLFAPMVFRGRVTGVLVVGPYLAASATAADVIDRWRWLTGRQGQPADPQFAAYLDATLATLVLDRGKARALARLLVLLTRLMASDGRADDLANRVDALRLELDGVRFAERMWEAAQGMIDERSAKGQYSAARAYDLGRLGLSRAADQVLIGLAVSTRKDVDAVQDVIARDALQRASVELAREHGDVISGRVGDHGVAFLFGMKGPPEKRKQRVLELAQRAGAIGKRQGFSLHFGAALGARSVDLTRKYHAALAAAERALAKGERVAISDASGTLPTHSLRGLRQQIARIALERADLLTAEFDRYVEAVGIGSAYRIDAARAELEICFDRISQVLLGSGALDAKSYDALCNRLDRASQGSRTMNDVFAAYRAAIADMSRSVLNPVAARQGRGLQSARDWIHQHYSERLSLSELARMAGFAPTYFSELFKRHEGTTLEHYILALRLERAQQLLSGTDLSATRVAELSGFRTPQYLCRVFRRVFGATPRQYRDGKLPHWAKTRVNRNRRKSKE